MPDAEKLEFHYFQEAKEELNKKEKNDDEDILDKILYHVGEMGRYQKWLFVGMMPFGVVFAFVYFVQMFIAATPQKHWCRVPELQHLDLEWRRNLSIPVVGDEWNRCLMYDANWTHVLESMQPPEAGTPTVPCRNGWEFELGDIPYSTVVSERGWVCEYSGYAPTAQAIFFAGSLVGGLFFGWLADTFGRVPALVGTNLIGFAGGIATMFTTGLWDFVFCRFLVGMAYDSCFMMMYILVLEYVGPRHRTWVANMSIALFFGSGCIMLPWLAILIADWRKLLLYTSLPMLVVLAAPLLVPESARWLSSRGRANQAVDVLKRFERVNGTKIPQDTLDEFIVSTFPIGLFYMCTRMALVWLEIMLKMMVSSRQTRRTKESLASVFRSPPLRNAMIYMVVVYMACAVIFDGLVRMSEGLGLDFFITFTLTSFTEIPSVTLLAFVLDRWGRRVLCCVPMTISGILTLIAVFCPKGIPQVSLAIMARFAINMSYNAAIQWSTELLPTGVRASGSSLIHVSGYVATVVSPFIVYSERIWTSLPLLILGLTAFVAAFFGVLLPETKGRPMPQSIADGEKLVREFSLCGGRRSDKDETVVSGNGTDKSLIT